MSEELESLERLAMPDELHIEECKKLGIDPTEDYEVVKQALLELKAIKEDNLSEVLEIVRKYESSNYLNVWHPKFVEDLKTVENYILKTQDDKQFTDLILNKPQLLNVFVFDGIHTWEEFEDTFSDEDKDYINTTKEEFEYMRNQLISRGKINE